MNVTLKVGRICEKMD